MKFRNWMFDHQVIAIIIGIAIILLALMVIV